MAQVIYKVDRIDPWRCRQHVAQHFDAPVMADNYLRAYEDILAQDMERLVAPPVGRDWASQEGSLPPSSRVA